MRVDVFLTPVIPPAFDAGRYCYIVVDVLRASSTIVTALANGCREIIPLAQVSDARSLRAADPEVLLGGERGGTRIPGFDLDNSPRSYGPEIVKGRRLGLTTSNGTRVLSKLSGQDAVYIGCFLNASYLAAKVWGSNYTHCFIVCAGTSGLFSLEDFLGAGYITSVLNEHKQCTLGDGARAAEVCFEAMKGDLVELLLSSHHGRELVALGLKEDVIFCAQKDIFNVVPVFALGLIRPLREVPPSEATTANRPSR